MRRANTLSEKYRPKRLGQIRGQDSIVGKLRAIIGRPGFDGGAFWFEGPSGTGKTCLASCIANAVGVDRDASNYVELDGDKCAVAQVRALDAQTVAAGLFQDSWRVIVVNEAHVMERKAVAAWLTLLERLPFRWIVVFTTTELSAGLFGCMGKPLIDRCISFHLTNQGLNKTFAKLARCIARREGLDGRPIGQYEAALKREGMKNSMRALLSQIERGDFCPE